MNNPLISVIIPVYNIEKYVRKCVESVMAQTYKNLEILLIDDGSTDGGGAICDELARGDGRVRVFHTKNAGAAAARNLGIEKSTGEYLAFIDGDDYVTADYAANLYNLLKEYRADISTTSYLIQYDGATRPKGKKIPPYTIVMDRQGVLENLMYQKHFGTYVWGRLFHRTLFDTLKFPSGEIFEDVRLMYQLLDKADRVVYRSVADYIYLQRSSSFIHSLKKESLNKYVVLSEEIKQYITRKYPALEKAAIVKCFCSNVTCLKNICFREIYWGDYTFIRANILKYRKSVLMNPKALFRHRAGAALSYLGVWALKILLLGRI